MGDGPQQLAPHRHISYTPPIVSAARTHNVIVPYPSAAPEVAPWLWAMEETRRGLLATVKGLAQPALDWRGPTGSDNSIGALLYHVALIEMSWLYDDVLGEEPPDDIVALFPHDHRDAHGVLHQAPAQTLKDHLHRLGVTRARFLEVVAPMSADVWHTPREPKGEDYACSPAWVVFHLVEHEAGHTFQVREIKRRWSARR